MWRARGHSHGCWRRGSETRGPPYRRHFEHGQWWITDLDTGDQWAVNDAEGSEANGVFDGFCFEQVTKGDD